MRRAPDPPPRPSASIAEAGLTPRDLVKAYQKSNSPTVRTSSQIPAVQASFQILAAQASFRSPAAPVATGSAGFESYRYLAELARSADFERTASLGPA